MNPSTEEYIDRAVGDAYFNSDSKKRNRKKE
jgi:hypothetical protein